VIVDFGINLNFLPCFTKRRHTEVASKTSSIVIPGLHFSWLCNIQFLQLISGNTKINAHITFWKDRNKIRKGKRRMVAISHCTHNRTDTSFTNIWKSGAKTTRNKSQNENMNNENQMVFSKQNFKQALVAIKT